MRLFRQQEPNHWNPVILSVREALAASHSNSRQLPDLMTTEMDLYRSLVSYRDAIFKAHCEYVLEAYLEPLISLIHQQPPPYASLEAVIVDTRPTTVLRAVILNAMLMLPAGTPIILITAKESVSDMAKLFRGLENYLEIRAEFFDGGFDQQAYNQLLCQVSFWQQFSAPSILIFQSDSLLLEPLPDRFLSVPYLGAPWLSDGQLNINFLPKEGIGNVGLRGPSKSFESASLVVSPGITDQVPHGYGNGGLSIRNRELMQKICLDHVRDIGEPEDVFFSRHFPAYCDVIPTIEMARQFSVEAIYANAVGIHASWMYLPVDKQAFLYEKHIMALISKVEGLT